MRVLFVSNGFPPRGQWGTEFYTGQVVGALRDRGHQLAVLHPERDGSQPRYTLEATRGEGGTEVFLLHNPGAADKRFVDSYRDDAVDAAFDRLLERWRPDLVHFTYLLWGLSVGMTRVARARGVPTVATLTDYGLLCHRGQMYDWRLERCGGPHPPPVCARCVRSPSRHDAPPLELGLRRLAIAALAAVGGAGRVVVARDLERREAAVRTALAELDRLIVPTAVVGEAFVRAGVPRERLIELVYSLDAGPLALARRAPPREPVVFGYLGQFTPHKGLEVLLRAVEILEHRLPESVEPWCVRLYGKPAGGRHQLYAPRLFARDHGPRVEVYAPFPPEEAPAVLATLHAIVMPSEWDENAPLTCLQARAAGIPLLGSDVPGIAEVITDGEHGRLFPVGDAEALADAMREVILGRLGRHPQPRQPLSLHLHLERLLEIYTELRRTEAPRHGPT
jgi:glycosyltransferase involved in cell wall biosynthesis